MAKNIKKDFSKNKIADTTNLIYGKVPPQAPELEEAVLGALLLDKDKLIVVMDILPYAECFYVDANQKIYQAILDMNTKGIPVDLLTVTEELRKSNNLEIVGGGYYLAKLTMNVASSAHVEAHAHIVMEKYIGRQLITISGMVINNAYENDNDVFDLWDMAKGQIESIGGLNSKSRTETFLDLSKTYMDEFEQRVNDKRDIPGIPTGFIEMDALIKGLQPSKMTVVAARPSVGKTSLATAIAINVAKQDIPVAFFSLEMTKKDLTQIMHSAMSGIELDLLQSPSRMSGQQKETFYKSVGKYSALPIFIDECPGLTSNQFRAKVRKLAGMGVKVFIIDYLQLMGDESKKNNREQEIANVSRAIKQLGLELGVHFIALSQMSRDSVQKDRQPELYDLRESGAIEQDADTVMFLWVPSEKYLQQNPAKRDKVLILIRKNRGGETTGEFALKFHKKTQRWSDDDKAIQGFIPMADAMNKAQNNFNSKDWQE